MNGDSPSVGQKTRPGIWLYGLAAVIFIAGWAFFGVILWKSLSGIDGGLQQVVVPGAVELNLPKPGKYTIFHEYESVVGSRIYSSTRNISGLECTVRSKATGAPVDISPSHSNATYSIPSRSGVSLLEFRIDQPGSYELSAGYPEGQEGGEVVLAVGQGIGLSIAIAVYTGVKRYKSGQRVRLGNAI